MLSNPPTTWPFIKPFGSIMHDPPSIGGPSSCLVWCTIDTSSSVGVVAAMVVIVGLSISALS